MSEQQDTALYIDADFSWDEPLVTDAGGGKTHFATLRLFSPSVIPFQAGMSFVLPGVYEDKYDEATGLTRREGQKQFKAMIIGQSAKKHHYYILVATKTDKAGGEYQVVKGFKSWPEKGRKNTWAELQFPALKTLPGNVREQLQKGQPIYVQFEDVPTGETFTPEGGDKTHNINYWGQFQAFASLEAMKSAEKVFFAERGTTNGTGIDLSNYPEGDWYSTDPAALAKNKSHLMKAIKGAITKKPGSFMDAAKEFDLVIGGKPVKVVNSETRIDLVKLFAEALDCPADDAELVAAFTHLYK